MRGGLRKVFILNLFCASSVLGFLSYPFDGLDFMNEYLKALESDKIDLESDLMKFAVPGEECFRKCSTLSTEDRKVCHFKFQLEYYQVLGGACFNCTTSDNLPCLNEQCVTADGVERGIMTINRQLPGPALHVCRNDLVVIDVTNHMDGAGTTLHWHGMRQRGTPFSDGVPFVTQCPIHFGNTFRYSFVADDSGTHFYHSHSGLQKVNGLFGALIVRTSIESTLYDVDEREHTMVVSDWMHAYAETFLPSLPSRLSLYRSVLINGRGVYFDEDKKTFANSPIMVYNVQERKRHRFRLINAGSSVCSFLLRIENHNLTVIASDGSSIEPQEVEVLHLTSGERYDIVIETNQEPRDYIIQFKGYSLCERFQGISILRYENQFDHHSKKNQKPTTSLEIFDMTKLLMPPPVLNDKTFNTPHPSKPGILIANAQATVTDRSLAKSNPDEEFYIFFGTPQISNSLLFESVNTIKFMAFKTPASDNIFNNIGVINNISLEMPNFSLMGEPEKITEDMFCDIGTKMEKTCLPNTKFCRCVHRLKVKLGSIVDLVLLDIQDGLTHPFHIHGHKFIVIEMGTLDNSTTANEIKHNGIPISNHFNPNPVHKDSVLVPTRGYTRIRFRADNPGFWLAHCHFEWHLAIGMGFILQVGELEGMKMPPKDFAKCGNFIPSGMK